VAEAHAVFAANLLAAKDRFANHAAAIANVELAALAREKNLLVGITNEQTERSRYLTVALKLLFCLKGKGR
jgi:hypothetical protein